VAVCLPVYGDFQAQFGYSLAKMMLFTGASLVADGIVDVTQNMIEGTYLDKARNDLTVQALNTGATHLLWLDSDMKFPQDTLMRLLAHGKEIVGVNYAHRRFPIRHTAFREISMESKEKHVQCRTQPDSTGLEPVDAIGFGVLLVQASVFIHMENPWFLVDQKYGEDVRFCLDAKKAGFQTYVDHDLSKEVVHYGPMGYTFLHAEDWIMGEEREAQQKLEVVA
jgi:hypothetical protein